MRKMNFDEYEKIRKDYLKSRAILRTEKVSASHLRDPKEREILARIDKLRWEKWQQTGVIKRLAPRKYKMAL